MGILKLKIMSANTRNVFKILITVALASAIMAAIPPTQDGEAGVIPGTMVTTDHHHHHEHEHHHSGTSEGDYDFSKDKFFQDNEGGSKKARRVKNQHKRLGEDKSSWGPSNRKRPGSNKNTWGPSGDHQETDGDDEDSTGS